MVWKSSVRRGKSSPVLTEKHLFITAHADDKLYTQCFDRRTGKLLWEQSVDRRQKPLIHKLNEPAADYACHRRCQRVRLFPRLRVCSPMTVPASCVGRGRLARSRTPSACPARRSLSMTGWFCKSINTSMVHRNVQPRHRRNALEDRTRRNQRLVNTDHLSSRRKGRCTYPHCR